MIHVDALDFSGVTLSRSDKFHLTLSLDKP